MQLLDMTMPADFETLRQQKGETLIFTTLEILEDIERSPDSILIRCSLFTSSLGSACASQYLLSPRVATAAAAAHLAGHASKVLQVAAADRQRGTSHGVQAHDCDHGRRSY